jgi:hypothetical protein
MPAILANGYLGHVPESEVRVSEVKAFKTRSGNTRYVLADDQGNEYSTFKEAIAAKLPGLEGRRARIKYHEQERDGFRNVYLDAVEPLEEERPETPASDADEVAWRTTIEAAPFLLGGDAVEREVPPDELFEKLQPFKELVADDIEKPDED